MKDLAIVAFWLPLPVFIVLILLFGIAMSAKKDMEEFFILSLSLAGILLMVYVVIGLLLS